MKNIIEFYYNIKVDNISKKNDNYYFDYNGYNFIFTIYDYNTQRLNDNITINNILGRFNFDKIIFNKENSPFTNYNNTNYILLWKKHDNNLSIYDIGNISNIRIDIVDNLLRSNWEVLWGNKIDYFERQISENRNKYPIISESFDYFVGMAENAISYLVNTKMDIKKESTDISALSHINLKDGLFNPLNIIFDHKARDIAEYIKISFFNDNYDLFRKLDIYFNNFYYSEYGIRVLLSRVLYPSFYFDLYDEIISNKTKEKELTNIISKTNDYEKFLYDVFLYFNKFYNIPVPEWIKKVKN